MFEVPDLVATRHGICMMWPQLLSDDFAVQGGLVVSLITIFGRSVHKAATL